MALATLLMESVTPTMDNVCAKMDMLASNVMLCLALVTVLAISLMGSATPKLASVFAKIITLALFV